MVRERFAQPLLEVGAGIGLHALDDPLVAQHLQIRDGHRRRDRMPGVRHPVVELAVRDQRVGDPVRQRDRTHRHVTARQALGERHQVGREAEVLVREPFAGAPEAADHFVGDEQHVVLAADPLDLRPVRRRRKDHAARSLERLADEGRDVLRAELENLRFELSRALEAERLGRLPLARFAEVIGLIDVDDVLDLRGHLLVHVAHAAERRTRDRRAVVAVSARNDELLLRAVLRAPVLMRDAQHRVVALGAAVAIEEAVERGRRDLREQRGQLDDGRMGGLEEGVVERQLAQLAAAGLDQFVAAVADVHAPEPGHAVDDPVAVGIPQVDAFGLHDHAAARAIERAHVRERVEVVRGVERAVFGARAVRGRGGLNPCGCVARSVAHRVLLDGCGCMRVQTCSSRCLRSHELITRKNASYSVSFSAR
ncbi:Uncharacterised protein [Burkholderia pseudomallei]|nr:Uncharacterised protein [Burkholderia pseudomallei]